MVTYHRCFSAGHRRPERSHGILRASVLCWGNDLKLEIGLRVTRKIEGIFLWRGLSSS